MNLKVLFAALHLAATAHAGAAVTVSIDAGKPGPVINKNVYGQFAEHLGAGVYGSLWVGPDSSIPNTRGWRNDVVGALKDLHVPLVRWPGGCFADEYHWREGIGPREQRPVKVNTTWGGVEEPNHVGTHEFFDLAEQLGADTYVNGNLGSGTVQEMAEWLEYMTSDTKSGLADLRRKNGRDKPFKVNFFAIGNEAWGCGGNMKPQTYATLYRQYQTFLKAPHQYRPKLIASGGTGGDDWTSVLARELKGMTSGISFHYYTLPTGKWDVKGAALGFPEREWISTLANTVKMEGFIKTNVAKLDQIDPKNTMGFLVDEWGTWYDVEPGTNAGFLYQQNSLRDALVAALNFNIFHKYADRVTMTNIAQMVNVLQAMVLTDKERMVLTPTYHAFHMYRPFQDAASLPVKVSGNTVYRLGAIKVDGVSASAARSRDGKLVVALVNTDPHKAAAVALDVKGASAGSASGSVLTADRMDAHNTFEAPDAIKPVPFTATAQAGKLTVSLPAKSVAVLTID